MSTLVTGIRGKARVRGFFLAVGIVAAAPSVHGQEDDLFEKQVRPILANNCYPCHGPQSGEGQAGLRLDSLSGMLRGGRSGAALVPGKPDRSLLIHAVNHDTFVQMPPKKKLPLAEIQTLTRWVEAGAPWPNSPLPVQPERKPEAPSEQPRFSEDQTTHWAFQPVGERLVPAVADSRWPSSPW